VSGKNTTSLAATIEAPPPGAPALVEGVAHLAAVRVRATSSSDEDARLFQERLALLGKVGTLLGSLAFALLLLMRQGGKASRLGRRRGGAAEWTRHTSCEIDVTLERRPL
jgi:hypothetical protein